MSNGIVRWNPLRELAAMQTAMDRLFDESWRPWMEEGRLPATSLALNVHEDEKAYTVSTELPGVKSENIKVSVDGDYLLIDAEIPEETVENKRTLMKERRYGRYARRVRLPMPINFQNAEASYQDGVLTLTLPKAEEAQPKLIPVKTVSKN